MTPLVERVESMRPAQMMIGVQCVAMVENFFAVIHALKCTTYNVMCLAFLLLQGLFPKDVNICFVCYKLLVCINYLEKICYHA